jgi:hypothetical protein
VLVGVLQHEGSADHAYGAGLCMVKSVWCLSTHVLARYKLMWCSMRAALSIRTGQVSWSHVLSPLSVCVCDIAGNLKVLAGVMQHEGSADYAYGAGMLEPCTFVVI